MSSVDKIKQTKSNDGADMMFSHLQLWKISSTKSSFFRNEEQVSRSLEWHIWNVELIQLCDINTENMVDLNQTKTKKSCSCLR